MKVTLTFELPVSLRHLIGKEIGMHLFYPDSRDYIMTEYAKMKLIPDKHENVDKHEYELGWNDCIEEIEG